MWRTNLIHEHHYTDCGGNPRVRTTKYQTKEPRFKRNYGDYNYKNSSSPKGGGWIIVVLILWVGFMLMPLISTLSADEIRSDAQNRGFAILSVMNMVIDTKVGSCNGQLTYVEYKKDNVQLDVNLPGSSQPVIYHGDKVNMNQLRSDPVVAKCFTDSRKAGK